ncbi:MAG: DNA cytosine methyltransferase, partial [Caulobacteraceae bacterium]|nr:DNA cytosine methyltransferase [Caulobacteraceae bacterium]
MRDGARRTRSGAFWPFWDLVRQSPPPLVVLENVVGVLTSRGGTDFAAILGALADGGYRFGALVLDAVHFLPQSRPRVFIIALRADVAAPSQAMGADAPQGWTWPSLIGAHARLPVSLARRWVWWRLPPAPGPRARLADIVEAGPPDVVWRSRAETESLIALMSPVNRAKLKEAMDAGGRQVGTLFRRTRGGQVRAEVRFDGAAGCLRTPGGGSSRQTLLVVEDGAVRSRLLSAREAARLIGLPDSHPLPTRYSAALHLLGDGVAVPVVRHLAAHLLEPLARAARQDRHEALRQAS